MGIILTIPLWRFILALMVAAAWGGLTWNVILETRRENQKIDELMAKAESEHDSCEGCRWNLGDGCCYLNVEYECAAGGGYEMWEEADNG